MKVEVKIDKVMKGKDRICIEIVSFDMEIAKETTMNTNSNCIEIVSTYCVLLHSKTLHFYLMLHLLPLLIVNIWLYNSMYSIIGPYTFDMIEL